MLNLEFQALSFLDFDDTVFTDELESFGDLGATFGVLGRNGSHRLPISFFELFGVGFEGSDDSRDSFVDTAFHLHGVGTSSDIFHASIDDGGSEEGGSSSTITSDIVGFGGSFFDELGTHVFKWVFEFDLLGDGNTIMKNSGGAPFFVYGDISAFGTESGDDSFS